MSYTEYVSHFSIWCIVAAPLITGNDLRKMKDETKEIFLDKKDIAVGLDPAGIQVRRVRDDGDFEIWVKPLGSMAGKEKAIMLFNRSEAYAELIAYWNETGLQGNVKVRDLWKHKNPGKFEDSFTAAVESHGVVMIKAMGKPIK